VVIIVDRVPFVPFSHLFTICLLCPCSHSWFIVIPNEVCVNHQCFLLGISICFANAMPHYFNMRITFKFNKLEIIDDCYSNCLCIFIVMDYYYCCRGVLCCIVWERSYTNCFFLFLRKFIVSQAQDCDYLAFFLVCCLCSHIFFCFISIICLK